MVILVIGKTGVGKSSVINLILGRGAANTTASIARGTEFITTYKYKNCQLVDSVGFDDVDEKTITSSLEQLSTYVAKMNAERIELIIYVMQKGRISKGEKKNYESMVKKFGKNQVPVLLVVTHCELEPEDWFLKEIEKFSAIGMVFTKHVCGCARDMSTVTDPTMVALFQEKRLVTMQAVQKMIDILVIKKNILVVGETGVGKSSLINLILGSNKAFVTDSSYRGTLEFTGYDFEDYRFIDTIGFNDVEEKDEMESLKNLAKFMATDEIKDGGIALIIFVMKAGRINKTSRKNYDFFKKKFCGDKVKVLLVATCCEMHSPMGSWYQKEKLGFEKVGMVFDGAVCGCTVNINSITEPTLKRFLLHKRTETLTQVLANINELALRVPWKPTDWIKWFGDVLQEIAIFGIFSAAIIAFLSGPAEVIIGGAIGTGIAVCINLLIDKFKSMWTN